MRVAAPLLVIIWVGNYKALTLIFDPDKDWFNYYYVREQLYSILFALFFFVCMKLSKDKITKAIFIFGLTISISSAVDKIVLATYDYKLNDIGVVFFGLFLAIKYLMNARQNSALSIK